MAKRLEFNDYTASVEDSDGDVHEHTVRAAVITDDTAYVYNDEGNRRPREVMTPTGGKAVSVGDVLVETEKPGVYDYLSADAWASTGYADRVQDVVPEPEPETDPEPETPAVTPAKKAVAGRKLPNGNGD